ncbi:MAG: ATP synthase F1 subunit delta [Lachnospiraceae bacterium]|nr:ATP synthase F1 subunit delta [Lachnospiraceae bacterium]
MARSVENVYADALFGVASESGKEAALLRNAQTLIEALESNPELMEYVRRPELSAAEREGVFREVFSGLLEEEMSGFLSAVFEKKREEELIPILKRFRKKTEEAMGIGHVFVRTAFPVTEAQKTAIEHKVRETAGYRELRFEYETDESLVGGIVIRINDRVVDGSVKTRLSALTRDLLKARVE